MLQALAKYFWFKSQWIRADRDLEICSSVSSSEEMLIQEKSDQIMQSIFLYHWLLRALACMWLKRKGWSMPVSYFYLILEPLFLGTQDNVLRNAGFSWKSSCSTDLVKFFHFLNKAVKVCIMFIEPVHSRTKSKVQGAWLPLGPHHCLHSIILPLLASKSLKLQRILQTTNQRALFEHQAFCFDVFVPVSRQMKKQQA